MFVFAKKLKKSFFTQPKTFIFGKIYLIKILKIKIKKYEIFK